jgi:hypothetical protein
MIKRFFNKLLILMGIVLVLLFIYNFYKYEYLIFRPIGYGDKVRNLEFIDTEKRKIDVKEGQWHLIVAATDLEREYSFIRYIDSMFKRKFQNLGLNIILLASNRNLEIFKKKYNISFPIVKVESNKNSIRKLGKFKVLLINPGQKVEFISNFVKEDDIRQLLEKNLIGKIGYNSDFKKEKLEIGSPFPDIKIREVGKYKILEGNFIPAPHFWIIFTSSCVSCALEYHLFLYSLIEKDLKRNLNTSVGLIFSPYFNEDEIIFRTKSLKIFTPVFIAESGLTVIEDDYYRKPYGEENVIVIKTDSNNDIIYLEGFSMFVKKLKEGNFDEKVFH